MNFQDELQKASLGALFKGFARVLFKRKIGNISFWDVRYLECNVQLILKERILDNYKQISKLPLGSIVNFSGKKIETCKNKHSIEASTVESFFIFNDIIPDRFHRLNNKIRYKNRVLDFISSEDSFNFFKKISTTIQTIRLFLYRHGYKEFNSNTLHEVFEGGQAHPFSLICNANKKTLYLSLTSELRLKGLLIAGFEKVFEISQSFRNEGLDAIHSPEFSLLEFYATQQNHEDMMIMVEEMMREIVQENNGTKEIDYYSNDGVKFTVSYREFARLSFRKAFELHVGKYNDCALPKMIEKFPKMFNEKMSASAWLMKVIEKFFVPNIVNPTFLIELPSGMSPFVKKGFDCNVTERAFFIAQRLFIADIYSDENDINNLKINLEQQFKETGVPMKDRYLRALSFGLVKTAGVGLGMNRLFMLFLNKLPKNIKETILYPIL